MDFKALIRDVPDFPSPGIVFKDITPLLQDPGAVRHAVSLMADRYRPGGVDAVVGIESRGFIFGVPLALELGVAFAPARKAGKLPRETVSAEYALEYGSALMELHTDALAPGNRVLLADDVLATGGTMAAARDLVLRLGGEVVGAAVLMELDFLNGREKLDGLDVFSLIRY